MRFNRFPLVYAGIFLAFSGVMNLWVRGIDNPAWRINLCAALLALALAASFSSPKP